MLSLSRQNAFVGLTNLGATCYVNTFLQMWFLNLELRQALYLCPSTCSTAGGALPRDKGGWLRRFSPQISHTGVSFEMTFIRRSCSRLSERHTLVFESITWSLGMNQPSPESVLESERSDQVDESALGLFLAGLVPGCMVVLRVEAPGSGLNALLWSRTRPMGGWKLRSWHK